MVPIQMELGGKDVCIVCADADLNLAAKHIVKGGFSYSGQRCTAVKLVMVDKKVRRGSGCCSYMQQKSKRVWRGGGCCVRR